MIVLTRLNDAQFAVNPDLIERIQANPDTTVTMVDGARYIVIEPLEEVIDRIALWRARVIHTATTLSAPQPDAGAQGSSASRPAADSTAAVPPHAAGPAIQAPLRPRNN